jgi:hypothetical protein
METLTKEESHIECRLCGGIVYSHDPTCKKCGLEMSKSGINDLAKIEDAKYTALSKMLMIKYSAMIGHGFNILSLLYFYFGLGFFSKVFIWFGFAIFIGNYIGWNQQYAKIEFSQEDKLEIKKTKQESLIIFAFSAVIGICIYIFLLK